MTQVAAIEWDDRAAQQYLRSLRQAPDITREEMTAGMQEILLLLEREIKDNTPVGVGGAAGLRGSITHQIMGTALSGGVGVAGKVFTPMAHGLPVELGTKPHFPPIAPIADWVHAKLGVPQAEAGSVAFLIARKISRKGTKGAHMFEKTFTEQASQISRMLLAALDRVTARLERGQ